eukprot:TRINITY_DN2993_c2_g1_i1.p1 TRINITY_DN2993_c2_g1~~TRINITY_DN2993_c2_g1_i1.p1  ORF type:complete len:236 (+),score=60.89 TRINITY_DN2993_c2_g1_i1:72-710(+)
MAGKQQQPKAKAKHRFASLVGTEELAEAVVLPKGVELNHWLATHCVDFYNITNVVYGSVTEFCTEELCPVMSCGKKYEYLWKDKKGPSRRAVKVSAPVYIDLLMNWAEEQINDETIFPTEESDPYPADFETIVRNIIKKLFRVYSHIYFTHFGKIKHLNEEPHINTAFKHFMLFVFEFKLMEASDMAPLSYLITNLIGERYTQFLGPNPPPV